MNVPHSKSGDQRLWRCLACICVVFTLTGCASSRSIAPSTRRFDFPGDTFAYPNELVREYYFDNNGNWTSRPRSLDPSYTHHCFVVARSARQLFLHSRFDPAQPKVDTDTYRKLIRQVIARSPRGRSSNGEKIIIPGYANLREFSEARESLLKTESGGAWQSYFQRGHWRMIFPFGRHHQEKAARQLVASLRQNRPPVVHLVRFPSLKINHAVLLFDATESAEEIRFATYDPNSPEKATLLTFDRVRRTFSLPTNFYFSGGRVDVYEIYRGCCY